MTGVQEDQEDSWTVVKRKNKNKKKSDVLQLNEKKGRREGHSPSPCCFRKVPTGTKVLLSQVPSSSGVDVFSGANDSAETFKSQNSLFQLALEEDPHFAKQVKSLELMLRVRERLASSAVADAAVRVS